jgi:hypothetical protein
MNPRGFFIGLGARAFLFNSGLEMAFFREFILI